jgi:hypothetical protein
MKKDDISSRFWAKVDVRTIGECWPWKAYKAPNGYGTISINNSPRLAHRIAWGLANGDGLTDGYREIPDGLCILHSCDNRGCVNPAHLRQGTYSDNHADMDARGRRRPAVGCRAPGAKLTDDQVEQIRALRGIKTQREIGAIFGIRHCTVGEIHNRVTWRHLGNEGNKT